MLLLLQQSEKVSEEAGVKVADVSAQVTPGDPSNELSVAPEIKLAPSTN